MVHAAATLTLALNWFFERALFISDLLTQPFPRYEKQALPKKVGGLVLHFHQFHLNELQN
jgi:hypothetical protein